MPTQSPQNIDKGRLRTLQTIAITGASRGIGASAAVALANPGRRLVLMARSEDKLRQTHAAVEERGGQATILPVDLSSREGAEACSKSLLEHVNGRLDVLILNAGTSNHADFLNSDLDSIEYELRLNYLSPLVILRQCLPHMVSQTNGGHVVCVGSLASLMPFPGEASYAASKAALLSLLRSLRVELRNQPVKLTTVLPGYTATEMTENHRSLLPAMSSERVGVAIAKAVDDRPYIVIPGLSNRLAARLFRTFPGISDRLLTRVASLVVPSVAQP
ncbi:MAG: SDR family NAD(P)-dependent oxidoreductase [Myxococcota bacterium]|nr:SDR family NAD(P)-dependent oxidoreductase [Myxococcota bacterium]